MKAQANRSKYILPVLDKMTNEITNDSTAE